MMRTSRVPLLVALVLTLASCRESAKETVTTPGGDLRPYCDAVERASFLAGEPKEDDPKQLEKFDREVKLPAFEKVAAMAPDEVGDDIGTQLDDLKAPGPPSSEANAARQRSMAFDHENCGWQIVDVTVTEYEIEGVPKELSAGTTSLKLANKGKEGHDLAFRRIASGVTESLAKIMEDEMKFFREKRVEAIGGMHAGPGEEGYALLKLVVGRYGMACFELVGGKGDEHHFERGELSEFTVR